MSALPADLPVAVDVNITAAFLPPTNPTELCRPALVVQLRLDDGTRSHVVIPVDTGIAEDMLRKIRDARALAAFTDALAGRG
ncbi:MAG: hypothetical protein JWP14_3402 [Frankiales bacterium]|nr:hypothetical protein [Frankiales bacterium]